MTKYFIVVAYDIPDDKRRTKLHKRLQDYGTPVQYSVFECLVDERERKRMMAMVRSLIKPRLDHVRFYHLCGSCQGKISSTRAGKEVVKEEDVWVV